ncbi:pollen receptor-like kinase 3 isoform X1 [Salvia splendens]|uniref:pollen receptor-like kinase 3 isoform X1 n=1 Tax=Salvia splendens TaxID=180675 RepID=UPI001C25F7ED|nr:pollen receptor-like kinase 3 isoform X1 [Salvia splendens]
MTTTAAMTAAAAVRPLLISLLFLSYQTTTLSLPGEDAHLIQFKSSLKDSSPLDSTWITATDPCDRKRPWLGVGCTNAAFSTVSSLLLMNLGLSNNDRAEFDVAPLEKLETLRFLSFENNSFSGKMPEFNRLSSLKSLFLSENSFSGEIPNDFFTRMGSLKKLELASNNFTGKIPDSLQQLDNLSEMLLQRNRFTGPVPSFEQKSLQKLDLSHNNLQGEIPQTLARFPASAFEGNPGACGAAISKPCKAPGTTSPPIAEVIMASNATTKWVVLAIVVAVLLVTILFKKKDKGDMFSMIGSDRRVDNHHEHAVEVHAPSVNRRMGSARRTGNYNFSSSSRNNCDRARSKSGDLVMINEERGVFGLPDLMKAAAEVLGNSGLGSAYKATMKNYGVSVVVKRMRGMNKLNKDAFDVEIRRLGRIRHRNILPPLAYHYRKEEKLLVIEFVPKGSLMFVLHGDRGIAHAELDWATRLQIIKGVARGLGFLHTELAEQEVPHGNLKSSNILLSANHEPLLTDYSLHPLSSNSQSLQAYKCPEAGLLSPKSDVYCLGVVVLEVMTGKFPSQYLNNQDSGTDLVHWAKEAVSNGKVADLIDPEIANGGDALPEMERMLCIGAACAEDDHVKRMEMREAIRRIEEVQLCV